MRGGNSRERLYVFAEQEACRHVQGIPEEQIAHLQRPAVSSFDIDVLVRTIQSAAVGDGLEQGPKVSLEGVQVADALPRELGSKKLSTRVPGRAVGCENAVAQKLLPFAVEGLALAVIGELGGKDCFDVLGVRREDDATSQNLGLDVIV